MLTAAALVAVVVVLMSRRSSGRRDAATSLEPPPVRPAASTRVVEPEPAVRTDAGVVSDDVIRRAIAASAIPAVTLRREFPPQHPIDTLTFFGGSPIAPASFAWPRHRAPDADFPLTFMAQIECAKLPDILKRDLLPADGVLYFFVPMAPPWQQANGPVVVHHGGPTSGWREIETPHDAPIPFGAKDAAHIFAWLSETARPELRYPRSFLKWPVAIGSVDTYPGDGPWEPETDAGQRFYRLHQAMEIEAMSIFHDEPVLYAKLEAPRRGDEIVTWRPYEGFPHVWLAVEMTAGHVLQHVARARREWERPGDDTQGRSADEQVVLLEMLAGEAHAWVARAREHDLMSSPDDGEKVEFWRWLDSHAAQGSLVERPPSGSGVPNRLLNQCLSAAAVESAEACLASSAAHAALVPQDVIAKLHSRHAAVTRSGDFLNLHLRHQMLGQPRRIQEAPYADDHLLLLQLDYDPAMYWKFGDVGAYQYWIMAEDLAAGRFDRVRLTFES